MMKKGKMAENVINGVANGDLKTINRLKSLASKGSKRASGTLAMFGVKQDGKPVATVKSHSRKTKGKGNSNVKRHSRKTKGSKVARPGFLGTSHKDEEGNSIDYRVKNKYQTKSEKHDRNPDVGGTFEYRVRSNNNISTRIALKRGLLDDGTKSTKNSKATKRTISDYKKALKKKGKSKMIKKHFDDKKRKQREEHPWAY